MKRKGIYRKVRPKTRRREPTSPAKVNDAIRAEMFSRVYWADIGGVQTLSAMNDPTFWQGGQPIEPEYFYPGSEDV